MRVIAGKYGSRRLKGPGKLRLRPTSDQLRETLFNILGPEVNGSLFIDVYAGTGAVGIEALSRGAREAIFIEKHPAAAKLVRENLRHLAITTSAKVLEEDVLRGLETLAARHLLADFIFLDPPYRALADSILVDPPPYQESAEHLRTLEFLDDSHLVAPYGWVIVEHYRKLELPERLDRLERTRLLEQGDAALSFYRLALAA